MRNTGVSIGIKVVVWSLWAQHFGDFRLLISDSGFTFDVFRAKSLLYMVYIGDFGF